MLPYWGVPLVTHRAREGMCGWNPFSQPKILNLYRQASVNTALSALLVVLTSGEKQNDR